MTSLKKVQPDRAGRSTPSEPSVRVEIVSDLDGLMACLAIRSATFLARGEPFEEEFDGNDLASTTHLIARQGKRPIGTMRVRLLTASGGGIASWERLAVMPNAGSVGMKALYALARYARAYSEFKGVSAVVGAVENPKLLKFWTKHGFRLMDAPPAVYNDVEYQQIRLDLDASSAIKEEAGDAALLKSLNGATECRDFDRFMSEYAAVA